MIGYIYIYTLGLETFCILELYRDNGKENGNYYVMIGCVYIYIGFRNLLYLGVL